MRLMPSAEHIARAIVSACALTGESPLEVAEERTQKSRARHYALQALQVVFPEYPKEALAFRVGCAGNPKYYVVNSKNGMARFVGGPHKGERMHRFWSEEVFAKVMAAIRAVGPGVGCPDDREETPRAEPRKLSAIVESIVEPTRPAASPGKRKLEDMLRAAVENTARMPVGE